MKKINIPDRELIIRTLAEKHRMAQKSKLGDKFEIYRKKYSITLSGKEWWVKCTCLKDRIILTPNYSNEMFIERIVRTINELISNNRVLRKIGNRCKIYEN